MKFVLSLLMFSVLLVTFQSCVKDDDTTPATYPIEGLWIGTYNFDASVPGATSSPQYFSFIIKPGGELIVESTANGVDYLATGNWTLNGTMLQCNYTYSSSAFGTSLAQTATATYENSGKLVSGQWFNNNSPNTKGTFTMNRIN
ncbi:MAG: hypothetical protein ACXWV0_03750 [Flavisolibacter sp.]